MMLARYMYMLQPGGGVSVGLSVYLSVSVSIYTIFGISPYIRHEFANLTYQTSISRPVEDLHSSRMSENYRVPLGRLEAKTS